MGSPIIKQHSDYEKILESSIKKSSVLETNHPITAISEQEKTYKKSKHLKLKNKLKENPTF